ncbi:MAG: 3-phosphoshikimate 1-carboxyvinyltransferase [Candidatus Bathyarchaeota archaeon]|nr:MAG: 3-phosphoshikimate 1-carboxyvinyltransferase [Candidatus Bathyarchaeota archaeon]
MTHRALICSALAHGVSNIHAPLISDDTEATARVLRKLGVDISVEDGLWVVRGGELRGPGSELFCGESGTTLRFMSAVCSTVEGECHLTGGPSLSGRPVEPLMESLRQLGVDCESSDGTPPVVVKGKGGLRSGSVRIRGDVSSQFISALLLVAPLGDGETDIRVTTPLESKPYVAMTIDAQRAFGVDVDSSEDMRDFKVDSQSYKPTDFRIEGDWSSAAFMLASGALAGEVTIGCLSRQSRQADMEIINILGAMGIELSWSGDAVTAEKTELRGIDWDLSDSPDLFPIVTCLGAAASGRSVLRGLGRLRFKESDRIEAMVSNLVRMGVEVRQSGDIVEIKGGTPRGAVVDPHGDHRIAMALAVLGLVADGETAVLDAECVSKSYPGFWEDFVSLGAETGRTEDE